MVKAEKSQCQGITLNPGLELMPCGQRWLQVTRVALRPAKERDSLTL